MDLERLNEIKDDLLDNLRECDEMELELTRFLNDLIECVECKIKEFKGKNDKE